MRTIIFAIGTSTMLACVASAQQKGMFVIDVIGGPVSPTNPSVTVMISAVFPQQYWAFGQTAFDLGSSDPTGEFVNILKPTGVGGLPASAFCAPWKPGIPDGAGGVESIGAFQISVLGCGPNPFNPIQIWEATWTTSDFAPREVTLSTVNINLFSVYTNSQSSVPDVFLNYEPASTIFQVIPAPSGALALFGLALASRRRR